MVKAMHGRIAVESKVNVGSKFSVYLSLPTEKPEPLRSVIATNPTAMDNKEILIMSKNEMLT
jgi:hypothetical protein